MPRRWPDAGTIPAHGGVEERPRRASTSADCGEAGGGEQVGVLVVAGVVHRPPCHPPTAGCSPASTPWWNSSPTATGSPCSPTAAWPPPRPAPPHAPPGSPGVPAGARRSSATPSSCCAASPRASGCCESVATGWRLPRYATPGPRSTRPSAPGSPSPPGGKGVPWASGRGQPIGVVVADACPCRTMYRTVVAGVRWAAANDIDIAPLGDQLRICSPMETVGATDRQATSRSRH
jgi:hypothetical protein